ncbi:MAG: ureidoglycolate lyase [Candidatus Humimicrobiaceae bacterium]
MKKHPHKGRVEKIMTGVKFIELKVERLTKEVIAPYGEIIGQTGTKPAIDNEDMSFTPGLSYLELANKGGMFSFLDIKRPRPFICENLERHINCTEALMPLGGQSICVVALSKDMKDPKSAVDINSAKAIIMDGSLAVNLKIGPWHWIPYPISQRASFVVVFEKDTHIEDLEIIDLKKDYNVSLKFILEK